MERRALVTGAASGIGAACVRRLASDGVEVVAVDADADGLRELGPGVHTVVADLAELDRLADLPHDVDILVNNAGVQHVAPIEQFPPDRFGHILRLMLESPFRLIRQSLPHMYGRGWGRIVNISSVHGLRASPFKSAYVAAKHGLEGLSKVVALEGAPHGVTSNCINPAYVRTPLVTAQLADQAGDARHHRGRGAGQDPARAGRGEAADRAGRGSRAAECALRPGLGLAHRDVPGSRWRLDRPLARSEGDPPMATMTETPKRTPIARVVGASLVGTTVEWYDFFLYGVAASVVFGDLFFPKGEALTGTLLSFATFAVGFFARPIGGVIFGHYGDRIGRKKLLVLSLLLMGVATFAIGLLPTYAQVGALAPILLTVLRLIQGFALGGEWGGAVLIVSEHGSAERRGYWASWPQAGAPAGQLIANGVLAALAAFQSDAAFDSWGWRIPFLLSAVLVFIGLWVRLRVEESPLFKQAQANQGDRPERMPFVEVITRYPREVLTAMGARMAENVSYYIFTIVIATYVKEQLGLGKSFALNAVLIGAAVHFCAIPLWGALSDRVGRKPVYLIGAVGVGIWGFVFFGLVDTKNFAAAVLAVVVGLVLHGAMYGPQSAFFTELFGTRVRYSGVSAGYQISSIIAGGLAPFIAVALLKAYDSGFAISVYVAACAVISVIAVLSYGETRQRDLRTIDR